MIKEDLIVKMTEFNAGDPKRIQHFLKVYEYDFSKLKNVDGVFKFETEEFDFEDGGVFDNQEEFNEFVNSSNKWVDLLYEITYSTDDASVVFHIGDMHRCMGSEYMC